MILISSSENDESTNHVIRWLYYYNKKFIRVNESTKINFEKITLAEAILIICDSHKEVVLNSNNISSYWYRRGSFNVVKPNKLEIPNNFIKNEINSHINYEGLALVDFLKHLTRNLPHSIGHISNNSTNKLENLRIAEKVGIKVPTTLVTCNKSSLSAWLKEFKKSETKIISKPINMSMLFAYKDKNVRSLTSIIDKKIIDKIPSSFYPTLFQEEIEKEFEIRTFFLNGKTYSMAIFSQNDELTKVDFRNYNLKNPNRFSKFTLPKEIEKKICSFMKKINLNCGSLDIIYSKNTEYVFLEVNPVGQFGMVSYPINYKLERLIARTLI
jgi:ATP-GRASP peptide maturase of grasp-with-spasm system